ncbi:hypothetical protein AQ925_04140 [Burkholderia pseudomallei]|nr:hypothetical protein AQ926_20970 [Burkholderia pseudomallei]ONC98201.1 hypothetical protein AQ925_04140 [Burkholderia pseudomallei]ONC98958.1 hypothetical protein AQ927_07815 [Burkholderia pseudomallei]OND23416.1 hypothetical protein AQ930_10210 [Burkholderia pseudomallei]OND24814.1 hypothetical protein AQ929_18860 [Burkholderia pseudomallei]
MNLKMNNRIQTARLAVGIATALAATQAFAVDTGASGMNSLHMWLMVWVPLGCAIIIIGLGVGLIAHLVKIHHLVNPVIGLVVAGSASALVGYFFT